MTTCLRLPGTPHGDRVSAGEAGRGVVDSYLVPVLE